MTLWKIIIIIVTVLGCRAAKNPRGWSRRGGGSRAYYIIHLCRPFAASSVLLLFYYVLFSSQTVHLPRCIERRFPRFSANCFETDFTVVHYWANARRGVEET